MTKEEIGSVLKNLRISCSMTQKDIAKKIGRTQQIVGHWETGYAQPDANTLFILCEAYGTTVDEAFGFSKKEKTISPKESEHLKKYRSLDEHGKDTVDTILDRELNRVKEISHLKEKISSLESTHIQNIIPLKEEQTTYIANAAHKRTDIPESELTPEMQQVDEDIMNDENF